MKKIKRFTKHDIEIGAYNLIKREGLENLNARNLANEINASTQPIFSNFSSMDEIQDTSLVIATNYLKSLLNEALKTKDPLIAFATTFVMFAHSEENLYKFLFMNKTSSKRISELISHYEQKISAIIKEKENVPIQLANVIYLENTIFIFGLNQQLILNLIDFNPRIIKNIITSEYMGTIYSVKNKVKNKK